MYKELYAVQAAIAALRALSLYPDSFHDEEWQTLRDLREREEELQGRICKMVEEVQSRTETTGSTMFTPELDLSHLARIGTETSMLKKKAQ